MLYSVIFYVFWTVFLGKISLSSQTTTREENQGPFSFSHSQNKTMPQTKSAHHSMPPSHSSPNLKQDRTIDNYFSSSNIESTIPAGETKRPQTFSTHKFGPEKGTDSQRRKQGKRQQQQINHDGNHEAKTRQNCDQGQNQDHELGARVGERLRNCGFDCFANLSP